MHQRLYRAVSDLVSTMSDTQAEVAVPNPLSAEPADGLGVSVLHQPNHRPPTSLVGCSRRGASRRHFRFLHVPYFVKQLL